MHRLTQILDEMDQEFERFLFLFSISFRILQHTLEILDLANHAPSPLAIFRVVARFCDRHIYVMPITSAFFLLEYRGLIVCLGLAVTAKDIRHFNFRAIHW
jgi:hypothetical protein